MEGQGLQTLKEFIIPHLLTPLQNGERSDSVNYTVYTPPLLKERGLGGEGFRSGAKWKGRVYKPS